MGKDITSRTLHDKDKVIMKQVMDAHARIKMSGPNTGVNTISANSNFPTLTTGDQAPISITLGDQLNTLHKASDTQQ